MRRSSAWTRKRRFRRSIARMPYCRCRRVERRDMGLSTTGTARCRCMRPSIRRPARCWARRQTPHVGRVRRLPHRHGRQPAAGKEIHVIADNLSAHKTTAGRGVPGGSPEGSFAFHADLLVLAQSGRAVVRQDRA